MELNRGDVIVNLKSNKEYAVVAASVNGDGCFYGGGVYYVGVRHGRSFGPIRYSTVAAVTAKFGKTAQTAAFTSPTNWNVEEVS